MIKTAINKFNPNLVFEIDKIDREAVGNAGIKEVYIGTLVDNSVQPAVATTNYKEQVQSFDSNWLITNVPMAAAVDVKRDFIIDLSKETFTEWSEGSPEIMIQTLHPDNS